MSYYYQSFVTPEHGRHGAKWCGLFYSLALMYIPPKSVASPHKLVCIYVYLPPCKTILLSVLNIVHDSRLDSSFILVSHLASFRDCSTHDPSLPLHSPTLYTRPLHLLHSPLARSHLQSLSFSLPLTRLSLTPTLLLSHSLSIYLFNSIIIHNCTGSTYYYYAIHM